MPNLYFCQPSSAAQAMLRAVLSLDDCKRLFAPSDAVSVEDHFPAPNMEPSREFAVLLVDNSAAAGEWHEGFYRFDADLSDLSHKLLHMEK